MQSAGGPLCCRFTQSAPGNCRSKKTGELELQENSTSEKIEVENDQAIVPVGQADISHKDAQKYFTIAGRIANADSEKTSY